MINIYRNRVPAWVMMGLLVVGLTGWFALPASGGFTLDDTLSAPYVHWQFDFLGALFNDGTDSFQLANTFQDGKSISQHYTAHVA